MVFRVAPSVRAPPATGAGHARYVHYTCGSRGVKCTVTRTDKRGKPSRARGGPVKVQGISPRTLGFIEGWRFESSPRWQTEPSRLDAPLGLRGGEFHSEGLRWEGQGSVANLATVQFTQNPGRASARNCSLYREDSQDVAAAIRLGPEARERVSVRLARRGDASGALSAPALSDSLVNSRPSSLQPRRFWPVRRPTAAMSPKRPGTTDRTQCDGSADSASARRASDNQLRRPVIEPERCCEGGVDIVSLEVGRRGKGRGGAGRHVATPACSHYRA